MAALQQETQDCQTACNQTHRLAALHGLTPDEVAEKTTLHLLPASYQRYQARSLPQDEGFVSFVRLVRKSGRITPGAKDRFMVNLDLAYTYVLARVDLTRKIVVISQDDKPPKTYDYSADTVGAWDDDDDDDDDDEIVNDEMQRRLLHLRALSSDVKRFIAGDTYLDNKGEVLCVQSLLLR